MLLDKLFKLRRMSAVDISRDPVEALCRYVADKEGWFLHFCTSQSNGEVLEHIVQTELANELDGRKYSTGSHFHRAYRGELLARAIFYAMRLTTLQEYMSRIIKS